MLLFSFVLLAPFHGHYASIPKHSRKAGLVTPASTVCTLQPEMHAESDRLMRTQLILAPMEVLADKQFRAAIGAVGGMDEAVHEFIRISSSHPPAVRGCLRNRYEAGEMGHIPLAAQIMGGDPVAMAIATFELATNFGAHRVDLNCGCPSKKVTGHGCGASLLKSPEGLYEVVRAMVDATDGIEGTRVSVKMRSGYASPDLFEENVQAAVEAGASMITLHPRTKVQAYSGDANWELIRRAKLLCGDRVEVVGNGDVNCAEDALRMLEDTSCDHVMVGRGAVQNPWIFWEIREALGRHAGERGSGCDTDKNNLRERAERCFAMEREFYTRYLNAAGGIDDRTSPKVHKMKIGRFKMLVGFATTMTKEDKNRLLSSNGGGDARKYLEEVLAVISRHYNK